MRINKVVPVVIGKIDDAQNRQIHISVPFSAMDVGDTVAIDHITAGITKQDKIHRFELFGPFIAKHILFT